MSRVPKAGAAHAGLIEWLAQRLTAVYMLVFLVYLMIVIGDAASSYEQWRAWFHGDLVRWAWTLFFVSLVWHSWIGLRSVFLDYIKPFWLRLCLTLGSAAALFVLVLWVVDILYIRGLAGSGGMA